MSNASGKRATPKKKARPTQKKPVAGTVFDIFELEKLIDMFQRKNITELEIERAGTRIKLGKHSKGMGPDATHQEHSGTLSQKELSSLDSSLFPITAPLVGTFYRASAADASPYVEEGDIVRKGQVLGLIEAMKLMNEIEAEIDGTVASIVVENGTPVEYGEPLILIRPKE